MGHGIEAEEAAKMFSIVSPVSPGQEGTAVEAALRAIEEMKQKGTGEEFGVKREMAEYASVKSIRRKNHRISASKTSGRRGQDQKRRRIKLAAQLAEAGIAADIPGAVLLVAGFGRQAWAGRVQDIRADRARNARRLRCPRKKRYEGNRRRARMPWTTPWRSRRPRWERNDLWPGAGNCRDRLNGGGPVRASAAAGSR